MESISFLDNIKHKIIMSSNIIVPSPNKSVATSDKVVQSEKVEKVNVTLDDIEDPVFKICQKNLDNKIERRISRNINSRGSL